jgi:hypothetical protein
MVFEGALEESDRIDVMRNINDGSIVGQIRRVIEMGLSDMGNAGQNQKT